MSQQRQRKCFCWVETNRSTRCPPCGRYVRNATHAGRMLAWVLAVSWCCAGVSPAAEREPQKKTERPNIVLIMCDDMGWSDLGCYGGEVHTPSIDRLAAEGIRFTQFYNNAVCWTTRASLITGLYPRYPRPHLRTNMATIAELLRDAGYQTALTGKWHLGRTQTTHPVHRGFDEFYGLLDGCCNYFDPYYRDPKYKWAITGDGHRYFAHNFARITRFPDDFYTTDAFTERAVRMLRRMAKSGKPFFLHVCYTAPHYPLHAKPKDIAKYVGRYGGGWEELQQQRYRRQRDMGLIDKRWKLPSLDPEAKPWGEDPYIRSWQLRRMEVYAAMIDCMDQGVGRIMKTVRELGIDRNTVVFFLSDNGPDASEPGGANPSQIPGPKQYYTTCGPGWAFAQNTPFRRFKTWMHEGGIATPFIARWPGRIRAGAMTDQVGHIIDLMPTCLELAGTAYPTSRAGRVLLPCEGLSLVPVLRGGTRLGHPWLFWHLGDAHAVRHGKWKLVMDRRRKRWELYDMETDRTETNNLAARYPKRVREMAARWKAWARRMNISK